MLKAVRMVRDCGGAPDRYDAVPVPVEVGAMNLSRVSRLDNDTGSELLKGSI